MWQDYLDRAEELRHRYEVKEIHEQRKEIVERVFADAIERKEFPIIHRNQDELDAKKPAIGAEA